MQTSTFESKDFLYFKQRVSRCVRSISKYTPSVCHLVCHSATVLRQKQRTSSLIFATSCNTSRRLELDQAEPSFATVLGIGFARVTGA